MSLTLKIAAGVFLGIIAVLIVLKIPTWIDEARNQHYQSVMSALTPDKLIARCGQPLKDTTDPPLGWRSMYYKDSFGGTVLVQFLHDNKERSKWYFLSMQDVFELNDKVGNDRKGADMQVYALPCVDKQ